MFMFIEKSHYVKMFVEQSAVRITRSEVCSKNAGEFGKDAIPGNHLTKKSCAERILSALLSLRLLFNLVADTLLCVILIR